MIIMPVPKDVRAFKPKFIGPFSKREFYGVAAAIVMIVITFAITAPFTKEMTLTQRGTIVIIPAVIPLVCGFIDIEGMPIWVYAQNLFIQNFLAPRHRLYKTVNSYEEFAVRNKITMEYMDDEPAVTAKQKKKKQKEYDKSLKEFLASHPEYESFL